MKRAAALLLSSLFFLPSALAQRPPRDPEAVKKREEDNRIENAAERYTKPQDTERDRFLKEVARIKTANPAMEVGKPEPDMIYDRMTEGAPEWTVVMARKRGMLDLFERVTARLNLTTDRISREQFMAYAASYLRPDNSPPYRTPADDEARAFLALDRNKDGVIDPTEASSSLREVAATFDVNRNNIIERAEYAEYFKSRVQAMVRKIEEARLAREAKAAAKLAVARPTTSPTSSIARTVGTSTKKVQVVEAVRFGHLPQGLPEWFMSLDTDCDGQVGLYEWNRAGRDLEDFDLLDANGDGLVTSEEWFHFTRTSPEEEVARFAPPPATNSRRLSTVSLKMR